MDIVIATPGGKIAAPDSIKKLVEEFERLKGGPPPDEEIKAVDGS
jgi:hypothetical protein